MSDSNTASTIRGGAPLDSIALPHDLVVMLGKEAKARRKSVPELVRQWLEDQADGRRATEVLKRIQSGKEKTYPSEEVWARHGI
jgi:predicted DNA-binding protein